MPRRPARSSPSRRSRAGSSSRSVSCSASRSRSRARSPCSTGSSSTSRWIPRSSTRPMRSRMDGSTMRGKVRFNDVSFHYPTAAVPSQQAHAAVNDRAGETANPEQLVEAVEVGAPIGVVAAAAGDGAAASGEAAADGGRRGRGERGRRPGRPRGAGARDRPVVRARGHRFRGGTRGVGCPGRCLRLGQDHDHLPRLAPLRRRFGRGRDRRRRCPQDQARLARAR